MEQTLNNCLPDIEEEIEFLQEIAKAISKKYKRTLILCYDDHLEGRNIEDIAAFSFVSDAPFQIVKNDTPITRNYFEKDVKFKNKLKSNIKNHIPAKLYNFIVMKSALEDNGLYKRLICSSGYETLDTYMESFYHYEHSENRPIHKFFIKIYQDGKIQIYS